MMHIGFLPSLVGRPRLCHISPVLGTRDFWAVYCWYGLRWVRRLVRARHYRGAPRPSCLLLLRHSKGGRGLVLGTANASSRRGRGDEGRSRNALTNVGRVDMNARTEADL